MDEIKQSLPASEAQGLGDRGEESGGNYFSQSNSLQIPLSDRLKAVGIIVLAGGLGVGTVLLGLALWHRETEETLLPIPESTESRGFQQKPMRDRVSIITPDTAAIASPQVRISPAPKSPQVQGHQALQPSSIRTNQDFRNASSPASVAATPLSASAPIEPQKLPITQDSSPPAVPSAASSINPVAVIASLLQAPQPQLDAPIAIAPRPAPAMPVATEKPAQSIFVPPPISQTPGQTPTQTTRVEKPSAQTMPPSTGISTDRPPASGVTSPPVTPTEPTIRPVQPALPPDPIPALPTAPAATQPAQPPTPPRQIDGAAPTGVAVKPPALQEGVYVDRLTITGNTRFSQAELAAVVQKAIAPDPENLSAPGDPTVINRRLSPAELVKASEAITKLYTERGYINSGAYVPAEVLEGAKPEIRVVEGSLESIKVQVQPPGFLWFARPLSPNYVEKRIARAVQAPLQIDQLVDVVKLLEQDPLIESISTELSPGASTGRSVLNVKVRQANPLKLTLGIDNARNPTVGRLRQFITLTHANLLGLGDRLLFGFNRSEGSRGLDLSYAIPINARNGTVSFSYSSNRGEVIEEPFRELDIKGRSQNYEIAIRQPIKQTSTEVIALSLRGTYYRNEGVFLESFNGGVPLPLPARGSDPDGKTRITALRFGQEWLKRGDRDVISLQSEFSVGINALDATQLVIPPDGRFFMWQGRGFWVHSFAPDTLLAVKAQLQLANRPLVPVEQISFGGIDTVRGYRTSTLLTDNGMFASAEMYLPVLRLPKWRSVVQVVPFFDIGRGWNRGDEQPNPSLLMSTGLGLQWKIGDNFRARLDWGIPLINSRTENGQSLRESLFFSIIFSP